MGLHTVACAFAGAASLVCVTAAAQVRDFPARPMRIVVPTSPGGLLDIVVRIMGQKLAEAAGQQVVIDNRPGASTNIGTEIVARAPADGYTMLGTTLTLVVNPSLFAKLAFDAERDFAPVSLLASAPYVLVVHHSVPARSVRELVAIGTSRSDALIYSSGGNGTNLHIAAELFNVLAGTRMTHVPYRGGGPALNALVAGETGASFPSLAAALPHVRSGRLRPLGITTPKRSPILPDLPTIAESGVAGYEFSSWIGFLVPAKTPAEIVGTLNGWAVRAARAPDVAARLERDGTLVIASSPAEFAAHLRVELARWPKVIEARGIQPE